MTEDEKEAEEILSGNLDFEFSMSYEVMPEINTPELEKLSLVRPVVDVSDKEIDEQIEKIGESMIPYEEKKGKAAKKDRVTMNYLGKIDGEAFDGGADNDAKLVLGSGTFIPGFEDQLIGSKAGDETVVKVKFPDEYGATHLAGKDAEFEVTVSLVEKPGKLEIDDEFASKLGMENVEKLREAVQGQLVQQFSGLSKTRVKRQVLDQLDEKTEMELPSKMVEQEYDNIWNQMNVELERAGKSFEDEGTTEEEAKKEYRSLAERRVRLGLVLANIGETADVEVTEEEMQAAVYQQLQQYPGQEEQVLNYFRENPDAVAGLRAPLYEDKVVDFIVEKAEIKEETITKEQVVKAIAQFERTMISGDSRYDAIVERNEGFFTEAEQEGFEIVAAGDGQEALFVARDEKPDLIILDLMMPEMGGYEFIRAYGKESETPIIILTAKLEEYDKVLGLEMGADDFVTKPFSPRELTARVRAVLRRVSKQENIEDEERFRVADITLDRSTRMVKVDEKPIDLTPTEFDLLITFMRTPGRVFSRTQLLDRLGDAYEGYERTIDVHIRNLRTKIEPNPAKPRYIETVYGAGYRFIE